MTEETLNHLRRTLDEASLRTAFDIPSDEDLAEIKAQDDAWTDIGSQS